MNCKAIIMCKKTTTALGKKQLQNKTKNQSVNQVVALPHDLQNNLDSKHKTAVDSVPSQAERDEGWRFSHEPSAPQKQEGQSRAPQNSDDYLEMLFEAADLDMKNKPKNTK